LPPPTAASISIETQAPLVAPTSSSRINRDSSEPIVPLNSSATIYADPITAGAPTELQPPEPSAPSVSKLGWLSWALIIWLAGAVLIFGRLLIGTASIWWIAHRAERITDAAWLNLIADISGQIGLTRQVRVFKTSRITMPVTCGLLHSAILFPADADDWPDERRQVVLLHELAHVKRWDCLTQLLAQIACSLYWFNP